MVGEVAYFYFPLWHFHIKDSQKKTGKPIR